MLKYGVLVMVVLFVQACTGFSGYRNPFKKKIVKIREAEPTIVLSHVIFRHGNRTPELSELYPKDPYLNYDYYPLKNGDLTNVGKLKEFSVGTELRQRYNSFLGQFYVPDLVDSVSTDRNRTKMSLILVLASLFPPRGPQIWKSGFNWQPVPYNYLPEKDDAVLFGISCPAYLKHYEEIHNSPEVLEIFNNYDDMFTYISENTGLNVTRFHNVYDLYFGLSTEEEYGLKLPNWTEKVWPDFINDISFKQYGMYTYNQALKKMAAGYFILKIITDTEKMISQTNNATKLYLYSAHENNLGQLLMTLDLFEYPHIPTYGTYLIFEVHLINATYGFKIYYQNYDGSVEPKLLKLPTCDEFCPLDQFKALVQEHLPESGLCWNHALV